MNLPPSSSFLDLWLCEGESDERFLDRIFNTRELKAQQVGGARNISLFDTAESACVYHSGPRFQTAIRSKGIAD